MFSEMFFGDAVGGNTRNERVSVFDGEETFDAQSGVGLYNNVFAVQMTDDVWQQCQQKGGVEMSAKDAYHFDSVGLNDVGEEGVGRFEK